MLLCIHQHGSDLWQQALPSFVEFSTIIPAFTISHSGEKGKVYFAVYHYCFLSYLTDQSTGSDLTRRLEKAVRDAKERREWSVEYMTLYEMRQMDREEGRKEGLEEGRKKGREEGIQEGQISDLLDIVKDELIPYDVAAKRAEQKYHIKEEDFRKMLDSRTK